MLKPQLHHMTTSSQPQATPSSQPQAQHPRDKIHFVPSIFPEIQYGLRFKPQLTGLAAVTHAVTFIQWSKLTITEEEYRNFWQDVSLDWAQCCWSVAFPRAVNPADDDSGGT